LILGMKYGVVNQTGYTRFLLPISLKNFEKAAPFGVLAQMAERTVEVKKSKGGSKRLSACVL
jgi:hypothetical protein